MNTKTKQTFELSEEDVRTAIAEFIENRFGAGSELTVSIGFKTVSTGYGMNERDDQVMRVTAAREAALPPKP